jgi:citrate synthase
MAEQSVEEFRKGLEGIVAGDSKVCLLDGAIGKLEYRGYHIEDLAANCSFEEVAYLLLYGKLPTRKELREFSKKLAERRQLPKYVIRAMKALPNTMNSVEVMRTAISALSNNVEDARKLTLDQQLDQGITLIAQFPTAAAYYYRLKTGQKPIRPRKGLGHAANFLYMMNGNVPDDYSARAMDMDFVLHAEHSFNASTFAVRVTISTLSDMYSAMNTGLSVLKGPLHGGAASGVIEMLGQIGSVSNVDSYISNALANKQKIMGIGHRVYRTYDPRARILKKTAMEISQSKSDMKWFEMADRIEDKMLKEKGLYPNVEFYSAVVYKELGLPADMDTAIFAIARSAGWVAHALEQYSDNRLIRPLDHYIGQVDLEFVQIGKRK